MGMGYGGQGAGEAAGLEPVLEQYLEAPFSSLSDPLSHSLTLHSHLSYLSLSSSALPLSVVFQECPPACLCVKVNPSLACSESMHWNFELRN